MWSHHLFFDEKWIIFLQIIPDDFEKIGLKSANKLILTEMDARTIRMDCDDGGDSQCTQLFL